MKGNSLLDTLVLFVLIFAVLTAATIFGMKYRNDYIVDLCEKNGQFLHTDGRKFTCQEMKETDHKNDIQP